MREIKFRGKRIYSNDWVYGYLYFDGKCYRIFEIGKTILTNTGFYVGVEVDPATVGQYTGLKDKNGKEIYDGDILISQYGNGLPALLLFGEYKDACDERKDETTSIGFYWKESDGTCSRFGKSIDGRYDYFEIIGNIHDNPELIK